NLVKGNIYVGPSAEEIPSPLFPGGKDEVRWGWGGEGVRVLGPVFSYNFRVGNRLFVGPRIPDAWAYRNNIEEPPDAWAERNTIEDNDIKIPNRTANALVAESRSDRTTFKGNIVRLASDGISCVGHGVESRNVLAEGNTIYGVESGVLAANTVNLVFRNNTIMNATFAGILLFFARNATITHNLVTDSTAGLHLFGLDGDWAFVAHISKNDIYGNDLQVEAYLDAPLELSVNGEGNYWGSELGWLPSYTNDPSMVTDSHPFLAPVAVPIL
ncbi:MAG TPA: NosD domain-containing protein, partial [bacterium]|nr:NosD domain-containing protein [bacterium]